MYHGMSEVFIDDTPLIKIHGIVFSCKIGSSE